MKMELIWPEARYIKKCKNGDLDGSRIIKQADGLKRKGEWRVRKG